MDTKLPEKFIFPDSVKRLPLIVTPRQNEPAESVVFRLALANGYRTINDMLRGTPNFPRELLKQRYSRGKYIAIAATLCGVAEEQLEAATPFRNSGGLALFGHHFRKIRAVGTARVCPACLSDDMANYSGPESLRPYRRNWWEIQNIGACPIHAIALVDSCPACDEPLQLIKSTTSCDCNPHVDIRRLISPTIEPGDLVHDNWLLGRLGVCPLQESPFLDSLPIDTASHLCLMLGTISENNFSVRGKRIVSPKYSMITRSIGWAILHNWPSSFKSFLDDLIESNSSDNDLKSVRSTRYGGLVRHLQAEDCPELEPVLQAIRSHVAHHQLISPTTRIFGQRLDLGENIALSAAAEIAGCGEVRFLKISDALELPSAQQPKVGTYIVPTANVEVVKDFLASSIEAAQLARQVGCDPKIITRLVDGGMLGLKLAGNVSVTNLIDRSDAEKLLSVTSEEFDQFKNLDDRCISAKQACRLAISGIEGVLTAIISHNLRGVGRNPEISGFRGLIFDRSDVLEAVNSIFGTSLSRDIIDKYEWKHSTLLHLRRLGYLNAALRPDYVYMAELNEFMAAHVSMSEMLDWQESPDKRRTIRDILSRRGVEPTIPTSAKVSGFWPRKAAREALVRAP